MINYFNCVLINVSIRQV